MLVQSCEIRDEIPQIYNINAGKNRQPTLDEVIFLREHLITLKDGLRDTQDRMKKTKDRLEMAWINLNILSTDIPGPVFQSWLERATSPLTTSPIPSVSPKLYRVVAAVKRRSGSQPIGSPDAQLHAKYVQFLGFISTLYVHQSTLRRYESNYALLKEELKLVKSLLDPVHGVPSEILEEIFLFVVEGTEMDRRKASVERGDHPTAKAWPAPFALSAVCRYWKELVCSRPRLWKYLVLDVRDKDEYYSTTPPRIHERIRQHLKFSHNLALDITIIGWGDYLRESIIPMIQPLLQQGCLARKLDTGVERVELVTGGMNDREAKYTEILEHLPPAQHLALVRVWQANTEIRVPPSFCARLRRIEAYDAVFRLEEPCPFVTEAALFKTDRVRIRTVLDQTPNLERLTIDGFKYADLGYYSPLPMTKLHTIALRVTDLYLRRVSLAPAIRLPALRKIVLINMPDMILSDDWGEFVGAEGQKVDEVEVRAIVPEAGRQGKQPAYLAHLCKLPALTSLHLAGDCARLILAAMAFQPISRSTQKAPISEVTRLRVSDCTLPKRMLQMYGWSSLNPSAPFIWRRGNAKAIEVTLERVHIEEIHVFERRFTN